MKAARTRALNAKHAGTRKHTGTGKHTPSASRRAATAHAQVARRTAASVKAAKLRALGGLPCCSHEAVAASARLAGFEVTGAATFELFKRTDGAASIAEALEAAYRFGLAGVRPLGFGQLVEPGEWPVIPDELPLPLGQRQAVVLCELDHVLAGDIQDTQGRWPSGIALDPCPDVNHIGYMARRDREAGAVGHKQVQRGEVQDVGEGEQFMHAKAPLPAALQVDDHFACPGDADSGHLLGQALSRPVQHSPEPADCAGDLGGLLGGFGDCDLTGFPCHESRIYAPGTILGLDLPEAPHAVTLDPSGLVWSWGGLYEMTAEAVVEEAWAVVWR